MFYIRYMRIYLEMENYMDNMIGQRIKERRKELKITQTQIQQETSISSGNLSCIENGKYLPSAIALLELSKVLDCSIDWILTGNSSFSNNSIILDNVENELLSGFRELSDEDRTELLEILGIKLRKSHKSRKISAKSSELTNTEKANMVG